MLIYVTREVKLLIYVIICSYCWLLF